MDKTYAYNDLILYTYPDGDTDRLMELYCTADVTTSRGITIGSSRKDVEKAYGSTYTEAGITLTYALSAPDDLSESGAVICGVFARRVDFSGLIPGESTKEDCLAALGAPDETRAVASADAYDRLPAGETLLWRGEAAAIELHFAENILYSAAILQQ